MIATDYHKQLFKVMPLQSVLLAVDAPKYTIVYVNDAYLKTNNTTEHDIIGKSIFEAFPNNTINPNADEVKILTLSLATTLKTKQPQKTVCQQYNIPINGTTNFEVRYFDCDNIPILNNNGDVEFLLHTIVDVTDVTKSTKQQLEINRIKSNQDALINGTTFLGEVTSVLFRDINGEEKSSISIRDITEIKKITAQNDNLLNVLQKSLNEIYIVNSKTLMFEYINESG